MGDRRFRNLFLQLAYLIGAAGLFLTSWDRAASAPAAAIPPFSTAPVGAAAPPGWEPLSFPKIPKQTEYALVQEGDAVVVRARSEGGASGLIHKTEIDLKEYPILRWRWKVSNVIQGSDVRSKKGDDYAARIYITFKYDPDKVSFGKKTKYKFGRLLFGDIPISAINYIWESKVPKETIVDNAYTDLVKMIVVESGEEHVGRWMDEVRNVYEDFKRAFREEPSLVNGVAIMTDTDDTGASATAYYADISFEKAPAP